LVGVGEILKIYIKIVEIPLSILINIKVLVYIILKNLTRKFQLKIKLNNSIKIVLLKEENKVKIISLILNTLIVI